MNDSPEKPQVQLRSKRKQRGQRHELARTDLRTFAASIDIPGVPGPATGGVRLGDARFGKHHLLWLDCLQQVEDGEIKRLMGLMPPGSAKSTYTSMLFPAHVMGRFPGDAGAGDELRLGAAAQVRTQGARHRAAAGLPGDLRHDVVEGERRRRPVRAEQRLRIHGRGHSRRHHRQPRRRHRLGRPDQGPRPGRLEAIRDKTWDAYTDDLLTRKKPGAWEIGITTRWHEDDVAGRILPEGYNGESGDIACRDGNIWHVVCIPAEAERADDVLGRAIGERIWPEHFAADHFTPFKRHPRTWAALYQQRPAPEEGDYFKADWLRTVERIPPHLRTYGASDYAVSAGGGDYTVHVVVGLDPRAACTCVDLWRKQSASNEWVEAFCDLV